MSGITSFVQFEHIPIVAMLLELDGTVIAVNEATCRMLGKSASELVGRTASELMHAGAELGSLLDSSHRQRELVDEIDFQTPTGVRTLEVVMSVISADNREILQLFGIDVTARKEAARAASLRADNEVQSSAKKRLESLGIVAGGIAHDFNNLLVGVLAEASAAREDTTLPEQVHESLRRIERSAKRMAQLTRSMLAYAGRGRVVAERLSPDEFLDEHRAAIEKSIAAGVTLVVKAAAGPVAIEADPALLRQVIGNLVTNACEADAKQVSLNSRIIVRDNASWWQLEVADDGEGIQASALSRVFEPFYTTRSDRTGLGLSAVQGIVRRLGGAIEVDSQPQRGARFRVRMPILAGVEAPVARHTVTQGIVPIAKLGGLRVLVADDEPSVRTTVRRLLERRGAIVVASIDGADAEHRLREEPINLCILDVSMPGRTGYDVLATARRTKPGVPVILMSGYTEAVRGAGGETPNGFLEKPFTASALDALIDEVMRTSR